MTNYVYNKYKSNVERPTWPARISAQTAIRRAQHRMVPTHFLAADDSREGFIMWHLDFAEQSKTFRRAYRNRRHVDPGLVFGLDFESSIDSDPNYIPDLIPVPTRDLGPALGPTTELNPNPTLDFDLGPALDPNPVSLSTLSHRQF
ncbi:hypothetical protein EVAR_79731_1 [Eumeta japonica]|uniref:Uncharacterized protein n=1 Tax=Eumeta variegata TaxID=151549 RepID=A0A4C1TA86_EUMVA|nr:hypothetical protein EVAR_79731_1 [Eumeta japonica]